MSVTLTIEGIGCLKFELHCDSAPKTCRNFLGLCASDYYIGTKLHKNIRDFIVQGGDPTGTGKGGESIYGAPFEDEISAVEQDFRHDKRGVLSMANFGPNRNGSQFFITYAKHASLDQKFTVFGQLVDGFQTLDLIEKEPVDKQHRPLNQLIISEIEIHANPIADSDFELEQEALELEQIEKREQTMMQAAA